MNLSNYTILEQIRLFTNTFALKLRCNETNDIVFVTRGHILEGQITEEQYCKLKGNQ